MIRLMRYQDYPAMSWKNGQGVTREVYRFPEGMKEYEWRISIATIANSGPFSRFDGYLRNISVLEGGGMYLIINGEKSQLINSFQATNFNGEAVVDCQVVNGPLLDFNVIYRADRVQASVVWEGGGCWDYERGIRLLFNAGDNLRVQIEGKMFVLQRYDCLVVDSQESLMISEYSDKNVARVTLFSHPT